MGGGLLIAGKLVVDEMLTCASPLTPGTEQRATARAVTGGGQVWHTALAAGRAGASVVVTGWCGSDESSVGLRSDLAATGVVDRLVEAGTASRAIVLVGPDGERLIVSTGGEAHLDRLDHDVVLAGVGWLHLDGYALDDRSGEALTELAETAYTAGVPVSLEPPSLTSLASRTPWLRALPPLAAVLGRPDEVAAVRSHLLGPPGVEVTHDGPRPVRTLVRRRTAVDEAPVLTPVPQVAVATTGAGDRFAGGWLAAVLTGSSWPAAAAAGVVAAGVAAPPTAAAPPAAPPSAPPGAPPG